MIDAQIDERRLAFGRVAELYDRARPSYPQAAVDAVMRYGGLAAPQRILEVGAGTGKATVLLAQRGLGVIALEPSPEMASVARANCARWPAVEVIEAEFEQWEPSAPLAALVCAGAWHWIAPDVRYQRAHRALAPGGTLAALWTFPDWSRCRLRHRLADDYRAHAPVLAPDFPMHPDSEPTRLAGDWRAEIGSGGLFADAAAWSSPWARRYRSDAYAGLLRTHQDHILLADELRAPLLEAITHTIEEHGGGTLTLPLVTHVCLARRAQPAGRSRTEELTGRPRKRAT